MVAGKRILGVVPARGGSKGVPRKNIRPLNGRPLLAYTIDQAKAAQTLDLFVVSTDDQEIKAVANRCGARVIDRPAELATDTQPTETALLHALDVLEASGETAFDFIVVLEPTSPLRSARTIDGCVRHLLAGDAPSLLTVRETRENIGKLKDGCFAPLVPGAPRRRQEREPFFVESSTVYVCSVPYLRRTRSLVAEHWAAFVVPSEEAEDINAWSDFLRIEALMQNPTGPK